MPVVEMNRRIRGLPAKKPCPLSCRSGGCRPPLRCWPKCPSVELPYSYRSGTLPTNYRFLLFLSSSRSTLVGLPVKSGATVLPYDADSRPHAISEVSVLALL